MALMVVGAFSRPRLGTPQTNTGGLRKREETDWMDRLLSGLDFGTEALKFQLALLPLIIWRKGGLREEVGDFEEKPVTHLNGSGRRMSNL